MRGGDWLVPSLMMVMLAGVSTLSWWMSGSGVQTRCTVAVALMGGVSVMVYEMSGHPWQIDMHMYFFATLAFLAAYCDYRPILFAAVAVALHHLTLNFLFPAALYPGNSDLGRVMVHALILVVEAAILVWLALQLSQMFAAMAEKTERGRSGKGRTAEGQRRSRRIRTIRPSRTATPRGASSPPVSSAASATSSKRWQSRPTRCRTPRPR